MHFQKKTFLDFFMVHLVFSPKTNHFSVTLIFIQMMSLKVVLIPKQHKDFFLLIYALVWVLDPNIEQAVLSILIGIVINLTERKKRKQRQKKKKNEKHKNQLLL